MSWDSEIRYITDGEDATGSVVNRPLQELAGRTDYLKTVLDTLSNKTSLVAKGVALSSASVLGDAVYFDAANSEFAPGFAEWSSTFGAQGELLPGDRSIVKGVIVRKSGSNTGDVLLAGQWSDSAVVSRLFGSSPVRGQYWLSDSAAGRLTTSTPAVKVPVATFTGGTNFVVAPEFAFQPNHLHREYAVAVNWLPYDDPAFAGMTVPASAVWGYNIADDADMTRLFVSYPGTLCIFSEGALVDSSMFTVNQSNLWWADSTAPTVEMRAFAYTPMSYTEPVVRAIRTETPAALSITAVNGVATVNEVPWSTSATARRGTAVHTINERLMELTPVVSALQAGPGAVVRTYSDGLNVVSLATLVESPIDADIYNLNNAVESVGGVWLCILFPKSRASSVSGRVPITALPTGASYTASVFAYLAGGGSQDTIDATLNFIPSPRPTGSASIIPTPVTSSLAGAGSDPTLLYFRETADTIEVDSEGTLYIDLSYTGSGDDAKVLRFGMILHTSNVEPVAPPSEGYATNIMVPAGSSGAVIQSFDIEDSGGAIWEYTLKLTGIGTRTGNVWATVSESSPPAMGEATSGSSGAATTDVTFSVDHVAGAIRLKATNVSSYPAVVSVFGRSLDVAG